MYFPFTFYNIKETEKVQVQKTVDGEEVQIAGFTVEIYKADMLEAWPRGTTGDRIVEFKNQRYKVVRDFPQGYDTQTLILTEVVR